MKFYFRLFLLVCSFSPFIGFSQAPSITAFTPTKGNIGTTITINGSNFDPAPANNIVHFGAVRATVTASSSSQLSVIVPPGASYQPISIAVNNLSCFSSVPFLPTFRGGLAFKAGFLATGVDLITGTLPHNSAMGDIDGDGKSELVVTNFNSNTISVFQNTGSPGVIAFNTKTDFIANASPYAITLADINVDGKLDVIVTNFVAKITVLLNTTTGNIISFAPLIEFTASGSPTGVAVSDLDGNGKPDIIVSNRNTNDVSIFENNSTGGILSFEPKSDRSTGLAPSGVTVTDLDNDGKADIAIVNETGNSVSFIRNQSIPGLILLDGRVNFSVLGNPTEIVSGDLDGDGKPELITSNGSITTNSISVLVNTSTTGAASFNTRLDYSTGSGFGRPEHLAMGDLNGDGKPELVIANRGTHTLVIFENKSTIGAISLGSFVTIPTVATPQGLSVGDVDGDKKPDIVVTSNSGNKISVLRNINTDPPKITGFSTLIAEAGTPMTIMGYNFKESPSRNTVFFGAARAQVTAATDTSLSVIVPAGATYKPITVTTENMTAYGNFPFTLVFNNGPTTLINTYAASDTVAADPYATDIVIADFDGDNKNDLAVTSPYYESINICINNSVPGNISLSSNYLLSAEYFVPVKLTAGDLNGDGRTDLAVTGELGQVAVFRNTGIYGNLFVALPTLVVVHGTNIPGNVYIHDLNGDGKPELIAAGIYLGVFPNTSVANDISFGPRIDFSAGEVIRDPVFGDFDGDGKIDVCVSKVILRNTSANGNISFAPAVSIMPGKLPTCMAAGDLNLDGKMDITVAYEDSNKVVSYLNTSSVGSFSFVRAAAYKTGYYPIAITISDLNGDSKPDIAVANSSNRSMSLYLNTSTGNTLSFLSKIDYTTGLYPRAIAAGDIDGDAKNDIAVVNNGAYWVSVFRYSPQIPVPLVPTITSFTPLNGPKGTDVTINGTNFSTSPDGNTVYFGAVKAEVVNASSNSLTVKVPAGATYQPISVTNNNKLTAYSKQPFVVTFEGGGSTFTSNSFEPFVSFPTGRDPEHVTIHDIDSDGKSDLLVVNKYNNTISILRNTSSGKLISFAPKIDYTAGGEVYHVICDDLNGDGKSDMIVTSSADNSISVFINSSSPGAISFAPKVNFYINYPANSSPLGLFIRDFDGDGKPDIAVASYISGSVSIFPNTSTGNSISFGPQTKLDGGYQTRWLTADDFDNDGKIDIASLTDFFVYANTSVPGTITFTGPVNYGNATTYSNVASGDLNNDGKPDVVFSKNFKFSVLRNESVVGTIFFEVQPDVADISFTTHKIVIHDLNGDGKPDVASPALGANIFRNTTNGNLISFAPGINYPMPSSLGMAAGDIDGDGKSDLVVTKSADSIVAVLRNKIGEPLSLCNGGGTTLVSNITSAVYQWQVSTDSVNFTNISDNGFYTGTTTKDLQLINIPSNFSGYRFRCVSGAETSELFIVRFSNTWTGSINNQWENPANWSCGIVPDMYTDVVVNAGAVIVVNSNVTIASLTLYNGATVTVNSGFDLTITGR